MTIAQTKFRVGEYNGTRYFFGFFFFATCDERIFFFFIHESYLVLRFFGKTLKLPILKTKQNNPFLIVSYVLTGFKVQWHIQEICLGWGFDMEHNYYNCLNLLKGKKFIKILSTAYPPDKLIKYC